MYQEPTALAFQEAGHKAAKHLTHVLRKFAHSNGWGTVSNHLHVSYEDGFYIPRYPSQIADVVHDLEFGSGNNRPNAVLRQFMNRAHEWSDATFDQHAVEVRQ
ncbi:MAG: hypothetical protein EBY26_03820 [Microbacteriaceae bacterium]|nr:hypothetical protein [Microbacteriaceae bacterium]